MFGQVGQFSDQVPPHQTEVMELRETAAQSRIEGGKYAAKFNPATFGMSMAIVQYVSKQEGYMKTKKLKNEERKKLKLKVMCSNNPSMIKQIKIK